MSVPGIPPDPVKVLYGFLRANWNNNWSSLANPPRFSTGDWSSDDPHPSVIVHARNESPYDGGDTGINGVNASGLPVQIMEGTVLVDCVAGTRSECNGVGVNGTAVNPKTVRSEMEDQVVYWLLNHCPAEFRSLTPGAGDDIEASADEEDTEVSFSHQRRARFEQRYDATPQ